MFKSLSSALTLTLAALAAVSVTTMATATATATAAAPGGPYAQFQYCPYNNTNVGACFISTTTTGAFKIGNANVPITMPIVLQGGVVGIGAPSPVYAAIGAPTLSPTALPVPGGLLGLMNPNSSWPGPLLHLFWTIVDTANDVTATAELVGPAQAYLTEAIAPDPGVTAVQLPIRIHLQNPLLGNTCYIGSATKPIVLNLVVGTTSPPPPNQPITGVPATLNVNTTTNPDGYILNADNSTLVDNAFAAPAASGCGSALNLPIVTSLVQVLITTAVNLKEGLPSAAGNNSASLSGNTAISNSTYVQAAAQ